MAAFATYFGFALLNSCYMVPVKHYTTVSVVSAKQCVQCMQNAVGAVLSRKEETSTAIQVSLMEKPKLWQVGAQ